MKTKEFEVSWWRSLKCFILNKWYHETHLKKSMGGFSGWTNIAYCSRESHTTMRYRFKHMGPLRIYTLKKSQKNIYTKSCSWTPVSVAHWLLNWLWGVLYTSVKADIKEHIWKLSWIIPNVWKTLSIITWYTF